MPLCAGARRDALHRLLGGPGHDDQLVRRRGARRRRRRGGAGPGAILIQVSGPAVDATGHRPGLLRLADLLPDGAGVSRMIGAISESINEYGGKVVLATPIEAILGTPVDVPGKPAARRPRDAGHASAARRDEGGDGAAKPIAAPLTVSGLSAADRERADDGGREGRAAGAGRARRARSGRFPPQTLRPGSAVAVGVLERRRAHERGRHRRLRRRRPGVGVRPPARGRRPARAAARRTPTSSGSSTTRCSSGDRRDLQARGAPGTTSGRSATTAPTRSPGASARCRTRSRSTVIARDVDSQARQRTVNTQRRRRGRGRPAERRLVDVVRRAAGRRRRPPAACSAARPAG